MKISGTVAKEDPLALPDETTVGEIKEKNKDKDMEQGNVIKQVKQADTSIVMCVPPSVQGRVPRDFKTPTSMCLITLIVLVFFSHPCIQSVSLLLLFSSLLWVLDAFATIRDFEKLHNAKYKVEPEMKKKEELNNPRV